MPVFSNPISSQNTATSGGIRKYPNLSELFSGVILGDDFDRETLNPTNTFPLYTAAVTGSGTNTIASSARTLALVTSASLNDNNSVRTGQQTFTRTAVFKDIDVRSELTLSLACDIPTATSIQGFLGFLASTAQVTALPTTTAHMGLYFDTSATGNVMLSYADGSTQTTSDTGIAISGFANESNQLLLQVIFNGDTSCVITAYKQTASGRTLLGTLTNTASTVNATYELHFFVKTLTTAARTLNVTEWWVSAT